MSIVQVEGLRRRFRAGRVTRVALDGVSFSADAGEIVGIVGPAGAGKSTLLRILAGELTPNAGRATVGSRRAVTHAGRRLVGFASDPPLVPPELTGLDWLLYLASHRAKSPGDRLRLVREAVDFGVLHDFVHRRTAGYSRGMTQRLAIAGAALTGESVVLLDEALAGVDPLVARDLRAALSRLAGGGKTVLAASHDLGTLERLATRVLVLCQGRVAADVLTADLLAERMAELALNGGALTAAPWLLERFPGSTRTGEGVTVPLRGGLTLEQVLSVCRAQRIAVAASRLRYRVLEDVLVAAVRSAGEP